MRETHGGASFSLFSNFDKNFGFLFFWFLLPFSQRKRKKPAGERRQAACRADGAKPARLVTECVAQRSISLAAISRPFPVFVLGFCYPMRNFGEMSAIPPLSCPGLPFFALRWSFSLHPTSIFRLIWSFWRVALPPTTARRFRSSLRASPFARPLRLSGFFLIE